jgi:hypothetical protein
MDDPESDAGPTVDRAMTAKEELGFLAILTVIVAIVMAVAS